MKMRAAAGRLLAVKLGLGLGLALPVGLALATPTKSVRVTTYPELAEGQVSGVVLSSLGEARSGSSTTRLALPSLGEDSVRALAATADGTVYLGSGGERPSVLIYSQGKLRQLARLEATTWVTAICPLEGAASGQLLVATAQDGRIFRVSSDGKSEVVAMVPGEHIWAMRRDSKRGVTYIASGPGALWAIGDADLVAGTQKPSKATKLFDSDSRQFLALDQTADGGLYVGTADDAVLYRVDPGGGARAVQDFAGNEVRAIAHFQDTLYVAVNDMQRGDTASRGTKLVMAPSGSAPGVKPSPATGSSPPANPSPTEKRGRGALFRIDRSGRVEQLHSITDGFFNALVVDGSGTLLAAASTPGGRGRVYAVSPQGAVTTVATALEVKESDALTLAVDVGPAKERLLGTGNSGALYLLREQPPTDANYQSKVFYAGVASRWGSLRYSVAALAPAGQPVPGGKGGSAGLRIETRSGNLAKPDSSWSPWQPLGAVQGQPATDEQAGKIASPSGRYLQVRALFAAPAVLRDFTFYYQPLNQRPRLSEILIGEDPSGRVARGVKTGSPLRPRSPLLKLRWKVENPDDDDLSYRLFLRRAGEPLTADDGGWLRLGGSDPLLRPELDWNSESVADGLYELKVVVSDERSNPPELALSHELLSPPFLIDNRRPEVRDLAFAPATGMLTGRAVDATSPIAELSYSVDGGELYPLAPRDGVLDDLSEDFALRPPRLTAGLHTLLVRASDVADNASTAQLTVQIAGPPAARP